MNKNICHSPTKIAYLGVTITAFILILTINFKTQSTAKAEVADESDEVLIELFNYPNPFDPEEGPTHIVYELSKNADVEILIYDYSGDLVLKREFQPGTIGGFSGQNTFDWDGKNDEENEVVAGAYICMLRVLISKKGTNVFERKFTKIGVLR